MNIAIIGTGRMAVGLANGWAKAGHRVVLGSRSPQENSDLNQIKNVTVTDHDSALSSAEVVVLAIPFSATEGFARSHAEQLRGKVVVDITNPFDNLPDNRKAAAEITADAIGEGARVVAAFKDNFAKTLDEYRDPSGPLRDVHMAGDDQEAKQTVAQLAQALEFQPVDCGSLKAARALDAMVPLLVEMDSRLAGGGRQTSWKFLGL